ncbi:GNAT family N-acetyltransferase [Microvirga roseola]|uniref:GNAT family N-acetyltransferase n=1 Tax=Microvirga roseola TaxID=2883126 RepID=UPI001E50AB28|nr:GNAT family N-acetyltransferase [Microvirga roseola]
MSYHIRTARRDELEEIGRLYHAVWLETQAPLQPRSVAEYRNEAFFIARVRRLPSSPLVAVSQNAILGFSAWSGNYLGQLYVLPEGRSLGLGRSLLQESENAMRASGSDCASLHCWSATTGAAPSMSGAAGGFRPPSRRRPRP